MSAVYYGGKYEHMKFSDGAPANGWQRYYQILKNCYDFFNLLGNSYPMQIQFKPAQGGSPSAIVVKVNGVQVYRQEQPNIGAQVTRLTLQSHWGSGVTFSNVTITKP
jgi:hypothetical protein